MPKTAKLIQLPPMTDEQLKQFAFEALYDAAAELGLVQARNRGKLLSVGQKPIK